MNESDMKSDVFNSAELLVPSNAEQFDVDPENGNPIQILVFPPKNKKFRYDQSTDELKIEPIKDEASPKEQSSEVANIELQNGVQQSFGATENDFEIERLKIQQDSNIKLMMGIQSCFKGRHCYLKGCKWSPDGFCLLSSSEDNVLRLFEIPESVTNVASEEVLPVVLVKEGGTIYDFEWYPKMNSSDPISCVFASTSQNSPIHLWDAYSGCLRATYQPVNQYDEVTAAYSLAFSPDGRKIYSGFKKVIRIFDISIPGRVSEERNVKPKGESVFQTSIISCISINPVAPNIYALGSYDRTVGIYTEPKGELQCLMKGHTGGVTEVLFSSNGVQLYSGGRKDPEIICWDMRNPGRIMCILKREVSTNQRIYFHLRNERPQLVTGSTDGRIIMYDTTVLTEDKEVILKPLIEWKGHEDCVNGVSFHPFWPILASSSGQYHHPESVTDDCDIISDSKVENSLKLWSIPVNI